MSRLIDHNPFMFIERYIMTYDRPFIPNIHPHHPLAVFALKQATTTEIKLASN